MRKPVSLLAALLLLAAAVAVADTGPGQISPFGTQPREGVRYHERVVVDTTVFSAVGDWSNAPLPDNVLLSTESVNGVAVNPGVGDNLASQAATAGTWVQTTPQWAWRIWRLPANQPLTPVRLCAAYDAATHTCSGGDASLRRAMAGTANDDVTYIGGGVPVPDDYTYDTAEAVELWQPAYQRKDQPAATGRLWELYRLRPNADYDPTRGVGPTNAKWMATSGGRAQGTSWRYNRYTDWTASGYRWTTPGDPDSTYMRSFYGVDAIHTFGLGDLVTQDDCAMQQIQHEVGLQVGRSAAGTWFPGQGYDGSDNVPTREGMRLRFSSALAMPSGMSRYAQMLFTALQKYGGIINDRVSGLGVALRDEGVSPGSPTDYCRQLMDGQPTGQALAGLPWSQLQVVSRRDAAGTLVGDTNPNPTG